MNRKRKPNIALIVLDSARRDMFGCYGCRDGLTPQLDQLAIESLTLMDHYAGGCGSAQAHVSLFLGQHSARHGKVHNLSELQGVVKALPLLLQKVQYRCYGHCMVSFIPPAGYEDEFGFDDFYYPEKQGAEAKAAPRGGLIEQLRKNQTAWSLLRRVKQKVIGHKGIIKAAARRFDGQASIDYMIAKLKTHAGAEPVFVYSTLLHPHTPYFPPRWCREQIFKGEKIDKLSFEIQNNMHAWANGDYGAAEAAIESMRKMYQAELLYADYLVGRFVEYLKQENLFENTLLIVTSDHGELFGDDGYLNHGLTVREELYRLPCIISLPGSITAGEQIADLTSALDIIPTIFDLIGEPDFPFRETTLDGVSVFNRQVVNPDRKLIVDSPPVVLPERLKAFPDLVFRSNVFFRAVRSRTYKYVWQSNGARYLYPVEIYEKPESSCLDEQAELAEDYHKAMLSFYREIDADFQIDQYPIKMGASAALKMKNPLIREELKKLGYL